MSRRCCSKVSDNYIFQDKTAKDIITELLADYPQVRFEFDVTQELAQRDICTQYRESDLEFLTRLLASEGLNWRFEHDQAGVDDALAFNRTMIEKHKVATIPGFAFGLTDTRRDNYQRLSFGALDAATVAEGVQRYVAAVKDWYCAG